MRTLWLAAAALRTAAAAWSDSAVAPQDCDALSGVPLQVLMYGNNDAYTLRKLDQGEWEKLFKINWFDGHINAAAVFEDDYLNLSRRPPGRVNNTTPGDSSQSYGPASSPEPSGAIVPYL